MDKVSPPLKDRLRRLVSPKSLPAWLLALFDTLWWAVEKGGDVEFLTRAGPAVLALIREWGWAPGIAWLGYLVVRPEKRKSAQATELPPGVQRDAVPLPPAKEPPPLSRGEREAVRDMRDLWKDCASLASDKMRYLALNVLGTIDGEINWVERLLRPDIDGLENATNSMDEMFKDSHITLQDSRQKFDAFFAAYATTACDLHYIDRDHLPLTKPPCTEWYKRWEIANAALMKGLKSLHNQPEYEGELKLVVIDSEAREFLDRRQFCSKVILYKDEDGYLSSEPPKPPTADALVEQYEYGVHEILNGYTRLSDKYEILGMVEEDTRWVASTIDRMKELGCTTAEISDFNVLGTYKPTPGLHTDPGINNRASQCAVRLERLKRIIAKYDSATPLAPRTEARAGPESEGERP